jgi:hypothetical protein
MVTEEDLRAFVSANREPAGQPEARKAGSSPD